MHTFLSPWCQRACTPPSQPLDVFANTNALPTPHCGDLYGGFIMRPDQSTQLPAPLPSLLEDKAWSFKSQASHQGFFFLVSCPHPGANQEPTQSCFNIKKRHSCHSRNSKWFWSPVSGMGVKDQVLGKQMLPVL